MKVTVSILTILPIVVLGVALLLTQRELEHTRKLAAETVESSLRLATAVKRHMFCEHECKATLGANELSCWYSAVVTYGFRAADNCVGGWTLLDHFEVGPAGLDMILVPSRVDSSGRWVGSRGLDIDSHGRFVEDAGIEIGSGSYRLEKF